MRTLSLLELLLLAVPAEGGPVAPPPREITFLHRPPQKPGEFAGKMLSQWEAEIRSGDRNRRLVAASAAHTWGRAAAPLARALLDSVARPEPNATGGISSAALELDHAAVFGALGPDTIPVLLDGLKSLRPEVRLVAAQGLPGVRPTTPEVVAALVAALDDPEHDVRQAAAWGLRDLGPAAKDALPNLSLRVLYLLFHSEVFGHFPGPGPNWWDVADAALAIDPDFWLAALLRADWMAFQDPIGYGGQNLLRSGAATPDILRLAVRRSPADGEKGRAAVAELCRQLGPRSAPVLVELIRKERELVRQNATAAPLPYPEDVWWMRRNAAVGTLSYLARCLGHRLGAEYGLRNPRLAIGNNVILSPTACTLAAFGPWAKVFAPELRDMLRDPDPVLRAEALYVLAATGDPEGLAVARAALRDGSLPPALRTVALAALAAAHDEAARAAALAILVRGTSPVLQRVHAIHVLGEFREPAVVPFAVAELDPMPKEMTPATRVVVAALAKLGPAAGQRAVPVLRRLAARRPNSDPDDDPVSAALALMRVDPTEIGAYRVWVEESGGNVETGRHLRSNVWTELDREARKHPREAARALQKLADELPGKDYWKVLCMRVRVGVVEEDHYRWIELQATNNPSAPGYPAPAKWELFRLLAEAGEDAAPALVRLLHHKEYAARLEAARCLGGLRYLDEAAGNALARRWEAEPIVQTVEWMVFALRNADRKIAVPALRQALRHREQSIRFHAAVALADFGAADADTFRTLLAIEFYSPPRVESWWQGGPTYPTPDGRGAKKLARVRAESLYRMDPEEAVRGGVVSPFVAPYSY